MMSNKPYKGQRRKRQIVIRNPTYYRMGVYDDDLMQLILQEQHDRALVNQMFYPVRCTHCGAIYDGGLVNVTARYADCSCWVSPCCKRQVDDRGKFWKSSPDIEVIVKGV